MSAVSVAGRLNATVLETEIADRYHARGCDQYSIGHDEYVREIHRFMLERYRAALEAGRDVALLNLGTLKPSVRRGAKYVHPSTGETEIAPTRLTVKFVASPTLRDVLAKVRVSC